MTEWRYHKPTHWTLFFTHQGSGDDRRMHCGLPPIELPFQGRHPDSSYIQNTPGYQAVVNECAFQNGIGIKTDLFWVPVAFEIERSKECTV